MTAADIQKFIESFAPPGTAWKSDNVGLLIGDARAPVRNVLVTLDVTEKTIAEALRKNANCIITHHPLIFHPLTSVTTSSRAGSLVLSLIKNEINLICAHTNWDSCRGGVNFVLAGALALKGIRILSPLPDTMIKIAVFVPPDHLEKVASAMHQAGGGTFTKYEECSFRTEGIGTFKGMESANPFIGIRGQIEKNPEIKLEMLSTQWNLRPILKAMRKTHPYEEIAYDVYPLGNKNAEFGLGIIGTLPKSESGKRFLSRIKKITGNRSLRYSGSTSRKILTVALCGGSGSELIDTAAGEGADVFITGDIRYHTFQDAEEKLLLIDAGHFETESLSIPALAGKISSYTASVDSKIQVMTSTEMKNPVQYF